MIHSDELGNFEVSIPTMVFVTSIPGSTGKADAA
jgi:hypothetical protein